VLWEEYRETQPDGYGYSRFCDLFREFERRLSPVMRQHYVAAIKENSPVMHSATNSGENCRPPTK
jgi:hypothetical protein